MNAVTSTEMVALVAERPQYIASIDGIVRNAAGVEVTNAYARARDARERLDTSCAGATLARVFLQHTWLAEFVLELESSGEYDDKGGTYRSINITISDPVCVPGAGIPEDFLEEGVFDSDGFCDHLHEELEDSNGELYDGFNHCSYSYEDYKLTVKRELIADLLLQEEIGGADAFVKLFPDRADLANGRSPDPVR